MVYKNILRFTKMFSKKLFPGVFAAVLLGASPCVSYADFYDDSADEEFYQET